MIFPSVCAIFGWRQYLNSKLTTLNHPKSSKGAAKVWLLISKVVSIRRREYYAGYHLHASSRAAKSHQRGILLGNAGQSSGASTLAEGPSATLQKPRRLFDSPTELHGPDQILSFMHETKTKFAAGLAAFGAWHVA